MTDSISYWV